ncbi:hypothetical protein [Hydrogenophaga sp.]|nr:hypothetical protein [Hydrogenophaga sp.]MDM7950741.1 hypothetical protein [Hydrogenophaga sp.]
MNRPLFDWPEISRITVNISAGDANAWAECLRKLLAQIIQH